jgi:hypothetical protein
MIESQKTINVLVDNIHKEKGLISNVVKGGEEVLAGTTPLIFKDYKFNYIPSYFVKDIKNWIYPIVILNSTFVSFLLANSSSGTDVLSLIPNKVYQEYKKNKGHIVLVLYEPINDEDIKLLVKTVETNPRYKNLLFMTMHYIDSPNFFMFNITEHELFNFEVHGLKYNVRSTYELFKRENKEKSINLMIDKIDVEKGCIPNLLGDIRHCIKLEPIFKGYDINYIPSYFAEYTEEWYYPVVVSHLFIFNMCNKMPIKNLIPKSVRRGINHKKGKILFVMVEAMTLEMIEYVETILLHRRVLTKDQESDFIFITPHIIDHPNFYTTDLNVDTMLYKDVDINEQSITNENNRKFCCFMSNYHERYIRGLTVVALENCNLLDEGFVSLKDNGKNFKNKLDTALLNTKHMQALYKITENNNTKLDFTSFDKVYSMLNIKNTLHKSLFNFVIEGSYDKPIPRIYNDPAGEVVHITEKTYRNFIYKKPFIILGQPGQLAFLHKLGYKTFHPIINENYDLNEDSAERFYLVMKEIKRLCSKSRKELIEMFKQVDDILEYNYNLYFSKRLELRNELVYRLKNE